MAKNIHDSLILRPPPDFLARFPGVLSLARQLSLKYVHHQVVTEQDLQTVGSALWQTLDAEQSLAQTRQEAGTRIVPLLIESADTLLQSLPWECLYHPEHGFLGKQPGFTLTRRLAAPTSAPPVHPKGPLKVLLFTSLPEDLDQEKERLDVESEQANVLEALDPLIHQGLVELTIPDDGRFAHFKQLLREQEFHLVFLSGHRQFNADPLKGPTGAWFLFEGDDGRGDPVEGKRLAETFLGTSVQAVVLSACQSGKAASDNLNASVAVRLLQAGLPHVVGMRESILDIAGIQFAHTLCRAIGRRERLDVALQEAREAIAGPLAMAGPYRDTSGATQLSWGQWCLPLLYSQDPAQSLIDWNFKPVPPLPPLWRYEELAGIPLPQTFIGRRRELRELGQLVYGDKSGQCLITGAGGQGKTSLAGRLAQRLEAQGYLVRAYTARRENSWTEFVAELNTCLDEPRREQVQRAVLRCRNETERAKLTIRVLLQQTGNRLALLFDNLETVQDPASGRISDEAIAAWLDACKPDSGGSPVVLVTSRWLIPGWEGKNRVHHVLRKPLYGDFLRYHQYRGGVQWGADQLRRLYKALGGNFKGLELFHAISQITEAADEERFLLTKNQAKQGIVCFVGAYLIAKEIGYAEVLKALENLAKQMGGNGLADWERLAQQMGSER